MEPAPITLVVDSAEQFNTNKCIDLLLSLFHFLSTSIHVRHGYFDGIRLLFKLLFTTVPNNRVIFNGNHNLVCVVVDEMVLFVEMLVHILRILAVKTREVKSSESKAGGGNEARATPLRKTRYRSSVTPVCHLKSRSWTITLCTGP